MDAKVGVRIKIVIFGSHIFGCSVTINNYILLTLRYFHSDTGFINYVAILLYRMIIRGILKNASKFKE